LPGLAPPAGFLWSFSYDDLGRITAPTLAAVADQAQRGIQRVCDSDSLVIGFLTHTGLSLNVQLSP
jgi:hypothetical protein